MFTLMKDEALAYLRLGLLVPWRHLIEENASGTADLGVLFVPGLGANGSQFLGLKRALRPYAGWFGAFEYSSMRDLRAIARELRTTIEGSGGRFRRLMIVAHSLGGLVARIMLQAEDSPLSVQGFVSISAPLAGTWRSKFSPIPQLRGLTPDSPLITSLARTVDRLSRLEALVTIAAERDQFIKPHTSAWLEGHERVLLTGVGHAASLFDPRTREGVIRAVRRLQ